MTMSGGKPFRDQLARPVEMDEANARPVADNPAAIIAL